MSDPRPTTTPMSRSTPIVEGADGRSETVATYYRETAVDYRIRMILQGHESIHFGYFEPEHRTGWTVFGHDHAAANVRLKEILADAAGIEEGTTVLDVGCGIGETTCWLAEHRGADVIGVNITETQLEHARTHASERGVVEKTEFRFDDFEELDTVADNSVDVVWGFESICHASEKRTVLAQARRVLRPGGVLLVADGFMNERTLTRREEQWMETYLTGWAVPHFAHHADFQADLGDLGFENIEYRDVTDHVMPSSKFLYLLATTALPVGKLLHVLGRISDVQYRNWKAARAQYKALDDRVWVYGIVTAVYPDDHESTTDVIRQSVKEDGLS